MPILFGDGGGVGGIEDLEPLVEDFWAEVLHLFFELVSHFPDGRGAERGTVEEGVDVKAGASDDDGDVFASVDFSEGFLGRFVEFGDVEGLVDFSDVDEVVGDEGSIFGGGFRCANIHAAIDLGRVGREDLSSNGLCEGKRKCRFTRCGRARNDEDPFFLFVGGDFLLERDGFV